MRLKLAVIGDPVAHSRSPALQREFLVQAGLQGDYEALRVAAGDGAARIDALRAAGYHGLNVTTPLKEEAYARADVRDAAAEASGAVNTLVLGARVAGYNTDGVGALGALAAAGLTHVRGRRILILGAGPTARACAIALHGAGAGVVLWNRTRERAERFARGAGLTLWHPRERLDAAFSTLLPGTLPPERALVAALQTVPIVVDANYGARATLGEALGRHDVHDGSAMLAASARAAFTLFVAAFPARQNAARAPRREGDSNSRDL